MESSNMSNLNYTQPTLKIPISLLGKNITVYRGGPESKTGKLLDVQEDYLVIFADNKVIYYQAEHVKSLSEDSKSNAIQSNNAAAEEEPIFHQEDNFIRLMDHFLMKSIQVNQGGPDAKEGILLEVGKDYLVLNTDDDGVVYYYLPHIKSIVEIQNNQENDEGSTEDTAEENEMDIPQYMNGSDFNDLCRQMSHKWVSINRKGPEALEGIFVDSSEGFYTLANNQELYRIHPYHVRNISFGPKGALKQQQNNNSEENEDSQENNIDQETQMNQNESSSSYYYNRRSSSSTRRQRNTSSSRGSSRNRRTNRRRRTNSRYYYNYNYNYNRQRGTRRDRRRNEANRSNRTNRRKRTSGKRYASQNRITNSSRETRTSQESVVKSVNFGWKPM